MQKTDNGKTDLFLFVKNLTNQGLDELLSNVLEEMRTRDSEDLKGDILTNSRRLPRLSRFQERKGSLTTAQQTPA